MKTTLLCLLFTFLYCTGPMGLTGADGQNGRDGTNGRDGIVDTTGRSTLTNGTTMWHCSNCPDSETWHITTVKDRVMTAWDSSLVTGKVWKYTVWYDTLDRPIKEAIYVNSSFTDTLIFIYKNQQKELSCVNL